VSIREGFVQSPVEVVLPGGELTIEWSAGNHVSMSGPATKVFAGRIDLEALKGGR
jgi:diaminopimelate epimerase